MREVGDPGRCRRRAHSSGWTAPSVGPLEQDMRGKSHLEAGPVWVGGQAAFAEHAILQPMRGDFFSTYTGFEEGCRSLTGSPPAFEITDENREGCCCCVLLLKSDGKVHVLQ